MFEEWLLLMVSLVDINPTSRPQTDRPDPRHWKSVVVKAPAEVGFRTPALLHNISAKIVDK